MINVLRGVEGVAFTFFDAQDVVRHPLVQRIVQGLRGPECLLVSAGTAVSARKSAHGRRSVSVDLRRRVRAWAPPRRELAVWADTALGRRAAGREIGVSVVGPAESRRLNAQFRGRDKPTNVLSFPVARAARSRRWRRAAPVGGPGDLPAGVAYRGA